MAPKVPRGVLWMRKTKAAAHLVRTVTPQRRHFRSLPCSLSSTLHHHHCAKEKKKCATFSCARDPVRDRV